MVRRLTRRRTAIAGSIAAASLTAFFGFLGLSVVLRPRGGSTFAHAPCWLAAVSGRHAPGLRGERCRLQSATNGFMFFDMFSEKSKEFYDDGFIKETVEKLINSLNSDYKAIDWEPTNLRSTRDLNCRIDVTLEQYYLAGIFEGLGPQAGDAKKKRFKTTPTRDNNVPVEICEFKPGRNLKIDDGACQIALMRPGAAERLGAKVFKATFKETNRVLQKGGLLLYFDEKGTELPDTALNYFNLQETVKDEPGKSEIKGFLLIRKPPKTEAAPLRRPARSRPRPTKKGAEESLDLNDGRLGITPGQLKDVFDELEDAI